MTAVAENIKLQIRRTYNADPLTVFNAWTNAEVIKEWFGPPTRTIRSVTADQRAGGSYRIEMESIQPSPNPVVAVYGTYTVFEPGTLLAFTWQAEWSPGEDSLVTIALKPSGDGTELLLTHERFGSEQSRENHNNGWSYALDSMAKLFPAA